MCVDGFLAFCVRIEAAEILKDTRLEAAKRTVECRRCVAVVECDEELDERKRKKQHTQ